MIYKKNARWSNSFFFGAKCLQRFSGNSIPQLASISAQWAAVGAAEDGFADSSGDTVNVCITWWEGKELPGRLRLRMS